LYNNKLKKWKRNSKIF